VLALLDGAVPAAGTPPLPAALAAHWLVSARDPDPSGPAADLAVRWLVELLGLPDGTAGTVLADGPTATVTALAAARHRVLAEVGWDAATDGLTGAPPVTVMVGEEAHPELLDALRLLGLGRLVRVRVDGQGRIRPTLIPPFHGPTLVCVQLGGAPSGAPDPVAAVCAEVHDNDAWVHVDGASGLWAAASPLTRDLVSGAGYADSWATDARLGLGVPYGGGLAFARDADALRAVRVPSRPATGVEIVAALLALGRDGVAELVERSRGLARRVARELSTAGYPVLNDVVLNQVLVGFGARTAEVIARVPAAGGCRCDGTVWHGRPALHISVGHGATDDDVTACLAAIRTAAAS
jgi:glutamate/tyrosine decarboxylase-like PLP-dependent enzyme